MSVERRPGQQRRWATLAVVMLLGAWLALALRFRFTVDDAWITFRYAANWADGHGLRFNLDGSPPVEGYSNFLWLAALAAGALAGIAPALLADVLSFAAAGALLLTLHFRLRRNMSLLPAIGGTALCALSPVYFVWSSGGLETSGHALALFATWLTADELARHGRGRLRTVLAAAALVLLRVEGLLWLLVSLALCAAWPSADVPPRTARRRLLAPLFAGLLVFAAYEVFRLLHFGDAVPQTLRVKADMSAASVARGARATASFLVTSAVPLAVLFSAPLALRSADPDVRRLVRVPLGMTVALLAWNTLVGGDWMPFHRFLVPAMPFIGVVGGGILSTRRAPTTVLATIGAVLVALLPAVDRHLVPRTLLQRLEFRDYAGGSRSEYERWRATVANQREFHQLGRALAAIGRPGDTLVEGAIGAIGYRSAMTILDRNGLVSREVTAAPPSASRGARRTAGHERRVARSFFLPRTPTYLAATIFPAGVGPPGSPRFDALARSFAARLLDDDPADEALFEQVLPEAHPLGPDDGLRAPATLVVLRYEADRQRARAYWGSLAAR